MVKIRVENGEQLKYMGYVEYYIVSEGVNIGKKGFIVSEINSLRYFLGMNVRSVLIYIYNVFKYI